jgi:hypothetical protein
MTVQIGHHVRIVDFGQAQSRVPLFIASKGVRAGRQQRLQKGLTAAKTHTTPR